MEKCQFGVFTLFPTSEKLIFKVEHTEAKSVIDLSQFCDKIPELQSFWLL